MPILTLEHAIIRAVVEGTCKQFISYDNPTCSRIDKHRIDMATGSWIDRLAAMAAVCLAFLIHSVERVPPIGS